MVEEKLPRYDIVIMMNDLNVKVGFGNTSLTTRYWNAEATMRSVGATYIDLN